MVKRYRPDWTLVKMENEGWKDVIYFLFLFGNVGRDSNSSSSNTVEKFSWEIDRTPRQST